MSRVPSWIVLDVRGALFAVAAASVSATSAFAGLAAGGCPSAFDVPGEAAEAAPAPAHEAEPRAVEEQHAHRKKGPTRAPAPIPEKAFSFGTELTALTPDNKTQDIGAPVHGEVVNFVDAVAHAAARFTHGHIVTGILNINPMDAFHHAIKVELPDGRVWSFHNDHGALEAVTPVLGGEEDYEALTQPIFDAFKDAKLAPEAFADGRGGGGGHIHVGRGIFDKNPLLLRNFLVLMHNHPEFKAVLEEVADPASPSIADLGKEEEFVEKMSKIDSQLMAGNEVSVEDIATAYMSAVTPRYELEVVKHTPTGAARQALVRDMAARNMDINVANLLTGVPPTLEIRTARAPKSGWEVNQRMKLVKALLQYANSFDHVVGIHGFDEVAKARNRSPFEIRDSWHQLLSLIGIEPHSMEYEWLTRFPVLGKVGEKTPQGYPLEVRFGRGDFTSMDISFRVLSQSEPRLKMSFKKRLQKIDFHEVEPGVWAGLAQVSLSAGWAAKEFTVVSSDEATRGLGLDGTHELWDAELGKGHPLEQDLRDRLSAASKSP